MPHHALLEFLPHIHPAHTPQQQQQQQQTPTEHPVPNHFNAMHGRGEGSPLAAVCGVAVCGAQHSDGLLGQV